MEGQEKQEKAHPSGKERGGKGLVRVPVQTHTHCHIKWENNVTILKK